MGKSKGGARRKGGKGDAAKVAAKASSTLSKRQEKKSQVRKAAARERKGALLSQLETRKAADAAAARGPLLGGSLGLDLDDALAEVAAAPARRDKNRPNAANNRGRRVIAAQETERFGAVLKDARFRASIGRGAGAPRATLPAPPPSGPSEEGGGCVLCPSLRPAINVSSLLLLVPLTRPLAWLRNCPQSQIGDAKRNSAIHRITADTERPSQCTRLTTGERT